MSLAPGSRLGPYGVVGRWERVKWPHIYKLLCGKMTGEVLGKLSANRKLSQWLVIAFVTADCSVSVLVSVRFETPCVLLHFAAACLMAKPLCLQDNAI